MHFPCFVHFPPKAIIDFFKCCTRTSSAHLRRHEERSKTTNNTTTRLIPRPDRILYLLEKADTMDSDIAARYGWKSSLRNR